MTIFLLGLVLFLGIHSARIIAPGWRLATINKMGANGWKGTYTLVSIAGFVLLIWGYSLARQDPVVLWVTPLWLKHIAALLTLLAFILLAAAYVPRNHFKAAIGHPMVVGVKTWAFAHLLANGRSPALILFAAFFVWAVVLFAVSRRSDRANGTTYAKGEASKTLITVVAGAAAWAVFALFLHQRWIGVSPGYFYISTI
jgi:uncharacterized membrane protein